jgi:hypothetical protein
MRFKHFLFFMLLAGFCAATAPACKTKSGCESTESLKPQTNKKGEFKKNKRKSGLFPKKVNKRM